MKKFAVAIAVGALAVAGTTLAGGSVFATGGVVTPEPAVAFRFGDEAPDTDVAASRSVFARASEGNPGRIVAEWARLHGAAKNGPLAASGDGLSTDGKSDDLDSPGTTKGPISAATLPSEPSGSVGGASIPSIDGNAPDDSSDGSQVDAIVDSVPIDDDLLVDPQFDDIPVVGDGGDSQGDDSQGYDNQGDDNQSDDGD